MAGDLALNIDLYGLNFFSVTIRLVLAVVIGGIIGVERGANKHPAGFRTHILVCLGAALAMLTNQYIYDTFGTLVDPGRLGAQVITGVGFLGVGTILVTGRHKIRGLTTAAGLWSSACIGLAVGIGFYVGAILAGVIVLVSLALLPKLESSIYARSRTVSLYVQIESYKNFKPFINEIKRQDIVIVETSMSDSAICTDGVVVLNLFLRLPKGLMKKEVVGNLNELPYVVMAEDV